MLTPLAEEPRDLGGSHLALAAPGTRHGELPLPFPPSKGLDANAEHLRGLADPVRFGHGREDIPLAR
jgi:hypothetical protein